MPGQGERERDGKHVRNDNEPAALYLPRRIYSRFSPPPFLLSSLHSAFCSTAAKSIDPAGHARPVAAPHSHQGGGGGGGGASIVREIFETKGRNNGGSPRPRLLFVTCRVSSIRCLFFPPPPWTAWLPSPEFRVLFFNAKGISTKREGSVNRYGYEKARGGIFSLLFAHPTFPSRDPRVGPRIRKRLETQHAQIVGCARSIPPLFRCPSPYRSYVSSRGGKIIGSDRASGTIGYIGNFFEDKKRERGKLLLLLLLLFVVGVKGWRKSGN